MVFRENYYIFKVTRAFVFLHISLMSGLIEDRCMFISCFCIEPTVICFLVKIYGGKKICPHIDIWLERNEYFNSLFR